MCILFISRVQVQILKQKSIVIHLQMNDVCPSSTVHETYKQTYSHARCVCVLKYIHSTSRYVYITFTFRHRRRSCWLAARSLVNFEFWVAHPKVRCLLTKRIFLSILICCVLKCSTMILRQDFVLPCICPCWMVVHMSAIGLSSCLP